MKNKTQYPVTIWLTGLSAAGKSTLAFSLQQSLQQIGAACSVLDGDEIRQGLNRDLGFSLQERRENIRRIAEVARLMNKAGLVAIVACISPLRVDRAMAKEIIGVCNFREVYVNTSLTVCESRDPKGLYVKARNGQVPEFSGISSPYEAADCPDLMIDTDKISLYCGMVSGKSRYTPPGR